MSETIWHSTQKARTEHLCDYCFEYILPGNIYTRFLWKPGGRTFSVMRQHAFPACEQQGPHPPEEECLLGIPITYQLVQRQVHLVLRNGRSVTEYESVIAPVLAPAKLVADPFDASEEVPF